MRVKKKGKHGLLFKKKTIIIIVLCQTFIWINWYFSKFCTLQTANKIKFVLKMLNCYHLHYYICSIYGFIDVEWFNELKQ